MGRQTFKETFCSSQTRSFPVIPVFSANTESNLRLRAYLLARCVCSRVFDVFRPFCFLHNNGCTTNETTKHRFRAAACEASASSSSRTVCLDFFLDRTPGKLFLCSVLLLAIQCSLRFPARTKNNGGEHEMMQSQVRVSP